MRPLILALAALLGGAALLPAPAAAQQATPIRLIVGFPPGGGIDLEPGHMILEMRDMAGRPGMWRDEMADGGGFQRDGATDRCGAAVS